MGLLIVTSSHSRYWAAQPIREQHGPHVTQTGSKRPWTGSSRKKVVFPSESPPNLSEPIRHFSRKVLVKFGEEKGNITAEARTRNLWRANPTRTPLDYRVSHTTRQGKLMYLSCNRKEPRKN